jgi:hypothetical protein
MGLESIQVDLEQTDKVLGKVAKMKDELFYPEAEFVRLVKEWGKKTGNEAFAATAVFLTTMFDFGGKSSTLFNKIANSELLAKYAWLFEPKVVVEKEPLEVEQACLEYFGPGGYNIANSAPEYWHNCYVIVNKYDGDIRNLFQSCDEGDAALILEAMDTKSRARNKKGLRRYGPKLGPMALERLAQWSLYTFKNTEKIDVPVDRHKAGILLRTYAMILLKGEENAHWVTGVAREILGQWCDDNKVARGLLSAILYTLGSERCSFGRHDGCPLAKECKIRLQKNLYNIDDDGKFRQVQDHFA